MSFFYDYFEAAPDSGGFGWSRAAITFGLPLGTLLTLWVGPVLAPRLAARRLILLGTGLTALTFVGFGRLNGNLIGYWALYVVYMVGNITAGPLSHQLILSRWFVRHRGLALSLAYLGISLVGALSARFVAQPLTARFGFAIALQVMGAMQLLCWPLVIWVMRESPADIGLAPDGFVPEKQEEPAASAPVFPSYRMLLGQRSFWHLLLGGTLAAGALAAVGQHLKLMLKDAGFTDQGLLDQTFGQTLLTLLILSAIGRLAVGWLLDRLSARLVLTISFALMLVALPFLFFLQPPATPYGFAILFGLATGADFLLVALLAGRHVSPEALPQALAILLPVMTLGQTWSPYFIALVRQASGSYTVPLLLSGSAALVAYGLLMTLPSD